VLLTATNLEPRFRMPA